MAFYGLYSVATGIADLVGGMQLEWWANLWLIVAGFILVLAAAFVRVSMLGGFALAVGGGAYWHYSRSASTTRGICTATLRSRLSWLAQPWLGYSSR